MQEMINAVTSALMAGNNDSTSNNSNDDVLNVCAEQEPSNGSARGDHSRHSISSSDTLIVSYHSDLSDHKESEVSSDNEVIDVESQEDDSRGNSSEARVIARASDYGNMSSEEVQLETGD